MNANDKMQEEGETEKGEETKQCSMRGENRYGAFKSHLEVLQELPRRPSSVLKFQKRNCGGIGEMPN